MAMKKTATDGTVFGVFRSANGNYVAAEDDRGFHHAPPQHSSLEWWGYEEARLRLNEAIDEHERRIAEDSALLARERDREIVRRVVRDVCRKDPGINTPHAACMAALRHELASEYMRAEERIGEDAMEALLTDAIWAIRKN